MLVFYLLLEFVAGPQCPVIEVATWLAFFDKLACIENSVVGLKPQMTIRLPTHFRPRISDYSRRKERRAVRRATSGGGSAVAGESAHVVSSRLRNFLRGEIR